MRKLAQSAVLKARAIAGTYVVVLAWDFKTANDAVLSRLLGFAIERGGTARGNNLFPHPQGKGILLCSWCTA